MRIVQSVDELRGRFVRLKRLQPYEEIQDAIGCTAQTLRAFVHGDNTTQRTLMLIEAWCDSQETSHDDAL